MKRTAFLIACGLVAGPLLGGLVSGMDRILTARMQSRIGPPLLQPFYDVVKLLFKEPMVVSVWQPFCAYCYIAAASISLVLFFLQLDLLLIFFVQAVGAVFLVVGALSSTSPYSHIGAHRELLQILSYEPLLVLVVIGIYLETGSFKLADIQAWPQPLLFKLPFLLIAGIAGMLGACAQHPAHVVSTYGSSFGCCGQYEAWLVPHSGVDFSGEFGEDVIAPADGMVIHHVGANPATCGNTIAIHHAEFRRYTVYCHFQDVTVQPGQPIKRGEKIGTLGDSGVAGGCSRIGRPCAIVHMELTTVPRGHPRAVEGETFDVLQYSAGCFEPGATSPKIAA